MQWRDEGVILGARRFGETGLILDVLTATHGRRSGLVYGGGSRRKRPQFEPGNGLHLSWSARLEEQLGRFDVAEMRVPRAAMCLDNAGALSAINAVTTLLRAVLDEGDSAGSALYTPTGLVLDALQDWPVWPALYARWELGLLSALGFGLDLDRCALSGAREGLTHVSPNTGRAVCGHEAKTYLDRLFALPAFLLHADAAASDTDIQNALLLTGHFITIRLFHALNRRVPPERQRLIDKLSPLGAVER